MTIPSLLLVLALASQTATRPAVGPPQAPATRPAQAGLATLEEEREEARRMIRAQRDRVPSGGTATLSDVLGARFENGYLLAELKSPPDRPTVMYDLAGTPEGEAVAEVRHRMRRNAPAAPADGVFPNFQVVVSRVGTGSDDIFAMTHLFVGPLEGQLNLSADRETSGGETLNVNVAQLLPNQEAEATGVRLVVNRVNTQIEPRNVNVVIESPTFEDLLRDHPALYEEFVRPMLAELGLSGALDPDTRVAAVQLFLDDLPVDPATDEKAGELLVQLDAADYSARTKAQDELAALGRPGATALLRRAREGRLSPEQASRVQAVVRSFQPLSSDAVAGKKDTPEFLRRAAALTGEPDDAAIAKLARTRLAALDADAASRPTDND